MTRILYSRETKEAHGALLEAGMNGASTEEFIRALKQLATMVHCDLTGELREPHTLVPLATPVTRGIVTEPADE